MKKTGAWDLRAIQPKDLAKELKQIEQKAELLEKKRHILTDTISVSTFMAFLKELEQFRALTSKVGAYGSLTFAENSANQKAVAEMSLIEQSLTKVSNRLLFFGLWFKDLPDKKAKELISHSGDYRYHLEEIRKTKPFTLQEKEEQIINIKDVTGVGALNTIYSLLTSQFHFTYKGKAVSQEELIVLARDSSAKVRKEAYHILLQRYKENSQVIGEIYKNIINDWREESITLRGYKTPLHVRNVANDIPDKAVEALLHVCEKNKGIFQEFFEIKRKKLGLKKMLRTDIYAPLKKEKEKKIPYGEALDMVIDVFGKFSPEFQQGALKIIQANHIHSNVQKNKQTGAFCSSVTAKLPPYCLWSYTGTLRDVSTIAHELGHGVHHILAKEHSEFTFHACLPLAETASIFAEMILSEKILEKYPEKAKELLFYKVDDLYASIIRQAGFVQFEIKAHEMMKEGKTIEEMSSLYLSELKKQLGNKVVIDDEFAYEWCYVPHIFHTPFYCYAYAFGNLLTLALYETYKEKGQGFAEKIIALLAKGGSDSPENITKAVGIDICSEEFWQKGFDVIKEMIEKVR
ncbi:MAG TPA: M3 family oligoendopeptidase [Candidatus Nanoarchaeia archaeon]|nr:M3 family oligoendopeptidase [Candidatus Nanoarchaeia archaeon]